MRAYVPHERRDLAPGDVHGSRVLEVLASPVVPPTLGGQDGCGARWLTSPGPACPTALNWPSSWVSHNMCRESTPCVRTSHTCTGPPSGLTPLPQGAWFAGPELDESIRKTRARGRHRLPEDEYVVIHAESSLGGSPRIAAKPVNRQDLLGRFYRSARTGARTRTLREDWCARQGSNLRP